MPLRNYPQPYEILTTKLDIPLIGSRILPRSRLTRLMQNGLGCRVTLVVAPAGYGKTTLLSEWVNFLASIGWITAWVSLDIYDNAPSRLWSYITAAVHKAYPRLAFDPQKLLQEGYDPADFTLLHPLLNEIAQIPGPICLILDDYQVITDETVQASLAYLIEHQPANLHLILSSRATPPIPLARMRAHRQILEISAEDLAFSFCETKGFFSKIMALEISPDEVQTLLDHTEGWVTGLQIAAISCQGKPGSLPFSRLTAGATRQILEYLGEEVLAHQPLRIQRFLLETSIFSELSPGLCDAVLECSDSRECLDQIEQANLFLVRVDEQGSRYRYHRLFAEVLQRQLERNEPNRIPLLHQRACDWLLANDFPDQAIGHALAANNLEQAAEILESCTMQAVMKFNNLGLAQWISRFSDEMITRQPQLGVYQILFLRRFGTLEQVNARIRVVEQILNTAAANHTSYPNDAYIRWELSSFQALSDALLGDTAKTIASYLDVIRSAPPEDTFMYGATCHNLGSEYELSGQLEGAAQYYAEGARFAFDHGFTTQAVFSTCRRARVLKVLGRLDDAGAEYERILAFTRETNLDPFIPLAGRLDIATEQYRLENTDAWVAELLENLVRIEKVPSSFIEYETVLLQLARTAFASGDVPGAEHYLDKAQSYLSGRVYPSEYLADQILDLQVRLGIKTGKLGNRLPELLRQVELLSDIGLPRLAKQAIHARIALASGQADEALQRLKELEENSLQIGALARRIESLVLQALTHHSQGQLPPALQALGAAIQLAAPQGYVSLFLTEGEPLNTLLEEYLRRCPDNPENYAYAEQLAAASKARRDQPHPTVQIETPANPLDEPLSAREIEVLTLLVNGQSRKEAAAALMISENTLKTHTRRIFRKIGSHNRAVLLRYALELGLPVK